MFYGRSKSSSSKPPGAPPAYLSQQSVALGAQVLERYCQRRYGELYGRNIERARDEDEDVDADEVYLHGYVEYANKFYKKTGKYIFPLLLLVGYGLLGGAVFQHLESYNEQQLVNAKLMKKQLQLTDLTEKLTDLFHDFAENDAPNISSQIRQLLNTHSHTAIQAGSTKYSWQKYWPCVFYASTIFTTIGNMVCTTSVGRLFSCVYAAIGIPLMLIVLDNCGHLLYALAQIIWSAMRRFYRRVWQRYDQMRTRRMLKTDRSIDDGVDTVVVDDHDDDEDEAPMIKEINDTLPMCIALVIFFIYTLSAAGVFLLWESKWTYAQSFYYFFMSCTTIGLGDQVPDHPQYALGAFLLFIVGLSLVSMCANVLHARVENRYMAALHIVEEQAIELKNDEFDRSMDVNDLIPPDPGFTTALPGRYTNVRRTLHHPSIINAAMPPAVIGIIRAHHARRQHSRTSSAQTCTPTVVGRSVSTTTAVNRRRDDFKAHSGNMVLSLNRDQV